MNINLEVSPELEGQLQQAAQTQGTDVNTYLLDSARLRLRPDVLPQAAASLLQTINAPLVPEARAKRDELLAEQAKRPLTDAEQAILIELVNAVEIANAQRWQAVAAQIESIRGNNDCVTKFMSRLSSRFPPKRSWSLPG